MTYLELINNVLIRLREETIDDDLVDSNPYFRSIGAHVNDAKDRVEDAWQWSALRGTDYQTYVGQVGPLSRQGTVVTLPNSADNHYKLNRVYSSTAYNTVDGADDPVPALRELRQITVDGARQRYQGGTASAARGQPIEFAITGRAPSGDITLTMYPAANEGETWTITIDRTNHQEALVASADVLQVPSLPVYSLATALASRERGEVGGTPTSELFAIADRHLSDAIAMDTALYPNEMDWNAAYNWNRTNFRTA